MNLKQVAKWILLADTLAWVSFVVLVAPILGLLYAHSSANPYPHQVRMAWAGSTIGYILLSIPPYALSVLVLVVLIVCLPNTPGRREPEPPPIQDFRPYR